MKETTLISTESHLAALERRHDDLEKKIEEARNHPSIDSLELGELKRRKLLIKDEIARLKSSASLH